MSGLSDILNAPIHSTTGEWVFGAENIKCYGVQGEVSAQSEYPFTLQSMPVEVIQEITQKNLIYDST
jgi:hypothetical protein